MRRKLIRIVAGVAVGAALAASAGSALADTQPTGVANADGRNGGASAPGPHCHLVLPAGDNAAFDDILSGAIHQAHTETGLPTGIFQAVPCE